VRPCESIADHSHGVVIAAMLLVDRLRAAGTLVDGERALRMAALHDAAEARTGDVPMPEKTPAMAAALRELEERAVGALLPGGLVALWREAEEGRTLEARVVKAADRIQMLSRALAYERQGRGALDEFWATRNLDDRGLEPAREVFEALVRRRPGRASGRGGPAPAGQGS
jgi:putative hydrolase of HD superfamily